MAITSGYNLVVMIQASQACCSGSNPGIRTHIWRKDIIPKKKEIKKGGRIKLVHTTDELTRLQPGDEGIILDVEGEPGDRLIKVKWDNGETLGLLEEIDKFTLL